MFVLKNCGLKNSQVIPGVGEAWLGFYCTRINYTCQEFNTGAGGNASKD